MTHLFSYKRKISPQLNNIRTPTTHALRFPKPLLGAIQGAAIRWGRPSMKGSVFVASSVYLQVSTVLTPHSFVVD